MRKRGNAAAGYSGTPLPKKLGIKAGSTVLLIGAPRGFRPQLGELPPKVTFVSRASKPVDLAVWFVTRRRELEGRMPALAGAAIGLWVAWPKKASGVASEVSENLVRDAGLAHGLVDYKVCAIDAVWSGLKFAVRKGDGHK
jgi:hypothetical protein